jgi:tetratricopeptide (TPR) repeat protein
MAYQYVAKIKDANIADVHVVKSQMALLKHQVGVALNEAELALRLNANEVDALKVKAEALIYSGEYKAGRELANRVIQIDPVVIAEPLYLIGLSYFAERNYAKAIDYAERASISDPATSQYDLLLAAAYGKSGKAKKANQAWLKFRKPLRGVPVWIAYVVLNFPFEDDDILQSLADGFEAAGAVERPPSRYLKLDRKTRLTGPEIKSLLFGHKIAGTDFNGRFKWQQDRSTSGSVSHTGISTHSGFVDVEEVAESWVEADLLCERWFHTGGDANICSMVFHDVARGKGNYYLMTDNGPHPFRVLN